MIIQRIFIPLMMADTLFTSDPICIGIIGGGQLGKMIAQQANRMSFKVAVLDPSRDCPASPEAKDLIIADFKDDTAILQLAKMCDVITYEIELASSSSLLQLERDGFPVYPSPKILSIIQDKFKQKSFLKAQRIPIPKFALVDSKDRLHTLASEFDFPIMLKACQDSYDGRGNFVIESENDVEEGYRYFSGRPSMVEQHILFKKEVSVMVARNRAGQVESFPIAENIHREGILHTTIVPANVGKKIEREAKYLAQKIIRAFKGVGIFGVEMFLTKGDELLVNEIAPRPHNSGHFTNEACSISQFEQHIRAILDLPLMKPELLMPAAMVNILGPKEFSGAYAIEGLRKAFLVPSARLYIYGKRVSQPQRKLGHITATGQSRNLAVARASKCKKLLRVISVREHAFD